MCFIMLRTYKNFFLQHIMFFFYVLEHISLYIPEFKEHISQN